jgi:cAMP-dependent protein kinase regulator
MLKWLCDQTKSLEGGEASRGGSTAEEIEAVRSQINTLKERRAQLLASKGGAKPGDEKNVDPDGGDKQSTKATDADGSEEEDDDDDAPDELPDPKLMNMNRGPRQSVSAEAYGQWNVKGTFTPPVYPKEDDLVKRLQACLTSSFIFSALEDEEIKTVILALKEFKVEPNTSIIKQGEDAECMYIIEDGDVDCLKTIEGAEKVVKTCGPGDAFGELALLYNCPRAASVRSREKPCQLWELGRETFNCIVKDAAAKKRTTYTEFLK